MKSGLLVYSCEYRLFNIGDYIQSIAAKQFFDTIDYHICREKLDTYNGEDVKIILNGWFNHVTDYCPLFVAMEGLLSVCHGATGKYAATKL